MPSTAIQATTTVTFRFSGIKPSPVLVFAKGGRKWIVASEVCRILGLRTDSVPKLAPEQDRGHNTILTKASLQSVITITESLKPPGRAVGQAHRKGAARVDDRRSAA